MNIRRLLCRRASRAPRRYLGEPGDHVVILNYKDSSHPQAGGAEKYAEQVAVRLVSEGQRVTLITARYGASRRRETLDGITIRRMGNTYTVYFHALLWLLRNKRRIDGIIDTCNGIPFFSPIVARAEIPVVILIHHVHQSMFAQHFRFPLAQLGRWIERVGNRIVYGDRAIVVVSPSSRTEVRRQLGLNGPLYVAANGQERLTPAGCRRSATPRIACVGRLVPHKRWERLIAAVADLVKVLPEVRLDLMGDGPCRSGLEALTAELNLQSRVTFHGRVADETRNELLSTAWLTVCTSEVEGWGLAVTEAMSLGIPAVASAVPGLRDSVRHEETGWIIPDSENLAACLRTAIQQLADPVCAANWADRCREWSSRFTWDATTDRLVGILIAEDIRRVQRRKKRSGDLFAIAELPMRIGALIDFTLLRDVDQVDWDERVQPGQTEPQVRLLLTGFDEVEAMRVVRRLAVGCDDPELTVRVGRPIDLIGWRRSAGTRAGDLQALFRARAFGSYLPVGPRADRNRPGQPQHRPPGEPVGSVTGRTAARS